MIRFFFHKKVIIPLILLLHYVLNEDYRKERKKKNEGLYLLRDNIYKQKIREFCYRISQKKLLYFIFRKSAMALNFIDKYSQVCLLKLPLLFVLLIFIYDITNSQLYYIYYALIIYIYLFYL